MKPNQTIHFWNDYGRDKGSFTTFTCGLLKHKPLNKVLEAEEKHKIRKTLHVI